MKDEWRDRIIRLKGEWRIKKRKRFWRRVLAWVLMIALIGGAIWVYLNWMQPQEEIVIPEPIEEVRG